MSSDEGNLKYAICPFCRKETQTGNFCNECGSSLTGEKIIAPEETYSGEIEPKNVRELFDGRRIKTSELADKKCSACGKVIWEKSPKVCPYCNVSFIRESEPVLKLFGVQTEPFVAGKAHVLFLRIENHGSIDSHGISANFRLQLRGSSDFQKKTNILSCIKPGKYSLLPVNLKFDTDGKFSCSIKLTYHDDFGNEYTLLGDDIYLDVLEKRSSNAEKELNKSPQNQVVINIENFVSGDLKKGNFTEIVDSVVNRSNIGTENVAIERQETITQTSTQTAPPAPLKVQPDVYYEVDTEVELVCGEVGQVFRIICAPMLRIGREGSRDDALANHIALGKDRYISRKQLQITPVDDGFLFDQGESPRRISCRGAISNQSFNLTGEEKFQIKVDKAGNLIDMKFKPFCDYRTPLALFMQIKNERILFVSGSIKLRWVPSNPDMLDISNIASQVADLLNEPYINQNAVVKQGSCTLKVKRITYSKVSRCDESNKWCEPVYRTEQVYSGTLAHKSDPDYTVCETSYGLKEPCEVCIIYDSAALGLWIKLP